MGKKKHQLKWNLQAIRIWEKRVIINIPIESNALNGKTPIIIPNNVAKTPLPPLKPT